MYLTDHREKCLKDVISEIEPSLFNKVVGISKKEFHLITADNFLKNLSSQMVYSIR